MNINFQNKLLICFLVLLPIISLSLFSQGSIIRSENRIVFLRFQKIGDNIKLLDYNITNGKLKQLKFGGTKDLTYKITDSSGISVWESEMDDPLIKRVEFENPSKPGEWENQIIKNDMAEFTVRVPLIKGIKFIEFKSRNDNLNNSSNLNKITLPDFTINVK